MKRVFTLSLAMTMAVSFCFAASSLPVTPADKPAAPAAIRAVAPTVPPPVVATAPVPAAVKASDVNIKLGNTGKTISLQDLATMNVADLEKMTGKKMGLLRRMEFRAAQRKLRRSINADGTLSNKRLAMLASKDMDGETGFHIGGFALGFFLGLIGVLIAYLINDEKKHNRVKWAWIGLAVIVVIIIAATA